MTFKWLTKNLPNMYYVVRKKYIFVIKKITFEYSPTKKLVIKAFIRKRKI